MLGASIAIAQVQTVAVAVLVISMMVSLGLRVDAGELWALVRRPRLLLLAAALNVLAVPLGAWAMARAFALSPAALTGLMLCAAAPAGPAAALYANTARADLNATALWTLALPTLGLLTTPMTVSLSLGARAGDPFVLVAPMFWTLLVFQALPLLIAMATRRVWPRLANVAAPWAGSAANFLLALVAGLLLVLKGHVLLELGWPVWVALFATIALAAAGGYVAALPQRDTARAGAITGASRNVTVALLLSAAFFPSPAVDATVLGFALLALVVPLGLALWWRRDGAEQTPDQGSADAEGTRKPGVKTSASGA